MQSLCVGLVLMATVAVALENHFSNNCYLCDCFIHYDDRDLNIKQHPYKVVDNAYDVTEDVCLAGCLKDENCKAAVFGYVGGRSVFTCEYYASADMQTPIYAPFTNIYLKRSSECRKTYSHYKNLNGERQDDEVTTRKQRFLRAHERLNPFNIGRR